jgi:hypothetical protein
MGVVCQRCLKGAKVDMRSIRLNLWHSTLILLVVWGFFTTLVGAAERFAANWYAPGLVLLMTLVAMEAIITQRLVSRERQRLEEQAGARLLELVVIVLLVRVWSLLAQGEAIESAITPWIREPLRFFGGRFMEYFAWSFFAWLTATLLASDVINWSQDVAVAGASSSTIERDLIQIEWEKAVARYDRRFIVIIILALGSTAFALSRPDGDVASTVSIGPQQLSVATFTVVLAGLLLHSVGRLDLLRRSWGADEIVVEPSINRRWGRLGVLILGMLLVAAPIGGVLLLLAPPPPLVPVVNALLVVATVAVSFVILLLGILMSPLILLFSLLTGGDSMPAFEPPVFAPPQIADTPGERPLWPALIFWGCVLLLIMIVLGRYLRGREDLRDALARWRILRWLFLQGAELWSDTRDWIKMATAAVRRMVRRRRSRRTAFVGSQAQLRALYRRMRSATMRRGVPTSAAQTPYEFDEEVGRLMPVIRDEAHGLVELYVTAEYGPAQAGPGDLQRARRHWRRLQRWLLKPRRSKRGSAKS